MYFLWCNRDGTDNQRQTLPIGRSTKQQSSTNQRSYVTWLTCNWKLKPWLNGGRTRTHDTKTLPCNGSGPRHPHIPSPFRTRQSSPEHSLRKLSDLHAGPVNIWPHFHWNTNTRVNFLAHCTPSLSCPCRRRRTNPSPIPQSSPAIADRPIIHLRRPPGLACTTPARPLSRSEGPGDHVGSSRPSLPACLREGSGSPVPDMASADLLRREEEFYSSLFDPAKGTCFLPGRCSYRARSRIGRPNVASFTPSLLKFWCVCAWTQVAASGRGRSWLRGRLKSSRTWPPRWRSSSSSSSSLLLPSIRHCYPFFFHFTSGGRLSRIALHLCSAKLLRCQIKNGVAGKLHLLSVCM